MRVHIHTPAYLPDLVGMTYATDGHASIFRELGWDVTIMVANVPLGQEITGHGRTWRAVGSGLSGSGLPWSRLKGDFAGLFAYMQTEGADVVLIEGWYTSAAALIPQFKALGAHVVMATHGSAAIKPARFSFGQVLRAVALYCAERLWIPGLMRNLDAALILSDFRDNERFGDLAAYEEAGVPQFHTPNFSEFEFAETPKHLESSTTLLHIGEMRPEKGQMHGVDILWRLEERYNLIFAFPSENAYFRSVMDRARQLGLSDRIQIVKGLCRHELQAYYDTAAAFLILSPLRETQPIVAVDGLTRAVPFVSTPVGCMPEMDGGVIGSIEQFPDLIYQIFSSEEGYRSYSLKALLYAKAELSRDRARLGIINMIQAIYP